MTDEIKGGPTKRGGRPAGKRGTFTFRVTADLRAQLEASAKKAERPVSEEIEKRLEQSYALETIVAAAATAAAKAIQRERFGSREIFESAELYGQILTGLINRLKERAGHDRSWHDPLDPARDYLKNEMSSRIDGIIEVFFFDLALKNLEGAERYELGALAKEWSIPRDIAAAHLDLEWRKHALRSKLLPHIMDNLEEAETDG